MQWNEEERRLSSWRPGVQVAMANGEVLIIAPPGVKVQSFRIDAGPPRRIPTWDFGDSPSNVGAGYDAAIHAFGGAIDQLGRIRGFVELAAHAIRTQYDVTPEELCDLIIPARDDEAVVNYLNTLTEVYFTVPCNTLLASAGECGILRPSAVAELNQSEFSGMI